jgi:hypothetical protein
MTDTSTDTGPPPVFSPGGTMQGNLTSSQGQPPQPPQPQPAGPPIQQQMEGVQQADQAAMAQRSSAMLKPMSALSSINATPMPQMGPQQKPPPAPDAKEYRKNSMAFASAMAVLGAVAGRFARVPGSAALSAFAGSLNGWHDGNMEAYETASKKWEQETKAAIENNRQVSEKYKVALENRRMSIDEQMSQIQLISAQYHDQIMYDAASAKNYTMVAQIWEKNHEFTTKAADAAAKLQEKRDEQKAKNEQSATFWLSPSGQAELAAVKPDGTPKYTTAQQASVKQLIDIYASKQGPKSVIGRDIEQYRKDFEAENGRPPTSDEITDFEAGRGGKIAAERARASAEPKADSATLTQLTKQKASIESFERTAIANGQKLKQLADKVDKTGIPAIERWTRGGRQATGDVDVAEFNTQMNVYRAEVAKIITNPNLSGVLSDSARREVDSFLSGGASAKQIKAVVDLLEQDFGRRAKSIDDEIETVRTHLKGGSKSAAPAETDPLGIR